MSTTPQKGRADYLELGTWNVACAECGRKRKAHEMRQLPPGVPGGGMYVCFPEHWNMRQPQDYVRGVPDKMAAPYVQQQVDTYPLYVENVNEDTAEVEIEVDTSAAAPGSEPLLINVQGATVTLITITDAPGGTPASSIVLNNNGGIVEEISNADDVPLTIQGNGITSPPAAYSLVAASTGFGAFGYERLSYGSLTPDTFNGEIIYFITSPELNPGEFALQIRIGSVGLPQTFFTSVTIGSQTDTSASADAFDNTGGTYTATSWVWYNQGLIAMPSAGTYAVSFV